MKDALPKVPQLFYEFQPCGWHQLVQFGCSLQNSFLDLMGENHNIWLQLCHVLLEDSATKNNYIIKSKNVFS